MTRSPLLILALTLSFGCGDKPADDTGPPEADTDTDTDADTDADTDIPADRRYVDDDASGGDGSSWSQAYSELSDALDEASSGGVTEIWVAAGTYHPGVDRWDSFQLVEGVSVLGGFAGDERDSETRDWEVNETILSGEIGGAGTPEDNSYHVVTGADDAVLDGFIVEHGYAAPGPDEPPQGSPEDILDIETGHEDDELLRILNGYLSVAGGGMLNIQVAPTVRNTVFRDNYAAKGGAVYNMVLTTYPPDEADMNNPAATFEGVDFIDNEAAERGGAINNDFYSSPAFFGATFQGNRCDDKGGALYNDAGCNPTLVNVLFTGNEAERGASIVADGSSSPMLVWVTITGNEAGDLGGGLYQGTYLSSSPNYPHLRQCLVLGNASGGSSSSVSNWLDDGLDVDEDSIIEYADGTDDPADYFEDTQGGDYAPVEAVAELGWDPERDTSGWEELLDDAEEPTIDDLPYDTVPDTGMGGDHYFVDATATGSGDGSTWVDAFTHLTDALAVATRSGDEVLVAGGTYLPTDDPSDREAAFVLRQGVSVVGSFCGGERSPEERSIILESDGSLSFECETILSGDIDLDETTDAGANSYHVVVGARDARLDGLIIEGGYADGAFYHGRGGGLLAYDNDSPELEQVWFRDNHAVEGGALMVYANQDPSSSSDCGDFHRADYPTLTECYFSGNAAERGGAAMFRVAVSALLQGVTFADNTAEDRGGALYMDYGGCTEVDDSTFTTNTAGGAGGAVYIDDNASQFPPTSPTFTDVRFDGNLSIDSYGGGMYLHSDKCDVTLDVTSAGSWFSDNEAARGGGAVGVGYGASLTHAPLADLGIDSTAGLGDNDLYVDEDGVASESP